MAPPGTNLVSPRDWESSYLTSLAQGRKKKHDVQETTTECREIAAVHAKIKERASRTVNAKLEERLADLEFWREELNRALTELQIGSQDLEAILPVLDVELKACKDQLDVAEFRQRSRSARPMMENVKDHAFSSLVVEIGLLKSEIRNLNFAMAETREKVRHGRKLIYLVGKLLKHRQEAENVELHCMELKADAADVAFIEEHLTDGHKLLSTNSWIQWNRSIVEAAFEHVNLMAVMKQHWMAEIERITEARRKARRDTEFLLDSRIREISDAKRRVLFEHAQLVDEVRRAEETIVTLKSSIAELEKLRKLTKSRLALRTHRPAHERTKDAVYDALHIELFELERLIQREQELVDRNERNLISLRQQLVILDDHIGDKGDALVAEENSRHAPSSRV